MSIDIHALIERAAAELKAAGAHEVYVFGSAVKGPDGAAADLDLAVFGLPPSIVFRIVHGRRLANRILLIIGGTTGHRFLCGEAFIAEGAKVVITGRNLENVAAAQKELGTST